ncbi:MAG: iron(III) transport system ATP-binding protein [Miltoncostaeaceae bacterium]|jgi:iron(III) transport system ATP-binding protein|nr:iron(III) transport system ATP-binding protein [Miltoncostaeaceae bacterium]
MRADAPTAAVTLRRGDAVVVSGLDKSFGGSPVLHSVSLTVAPGTTLALLGPSGCGKTTLLRCIAGLERPDAGSIAVAGRTLVAPGTFVAPEKRRVGMVFQDPALFPHMSVARNVAYGLPRAPDRDERVRAALALVDLPGFGDRAPGTLSGGQQQRVALARALATRPSVILLDEPFSALDAPLRVALRLEVRRLLADLGATAVFVTHDQEEAFLVGDEVAVMFDGAIVQIGSPADLYDLPATRRVAEFIGDANLLQGVADGERALTALGAVPLSDGREGAVEVMVRPERIRASAGGGARVEAIEYYGHDAVYLLRLEDGSTLRSRAMGAPAFGPGDRVALEFVGPPTVAYAAARELVADPPG